MKRKKYATEVGFTLERVKQLRFEYNKAQVEGLKTFWFTIGYDPKENIGLEAELDTQYAGLLLTFLEHEFGITEDVLQNRRPS